MPGPTRRDIPIWRKPVTKEKSMHTAFLGKKEDLTQSNWSIGAQGGAGHVKGKRHANDEDQQEHWPIPIPEAWPHE